VWLLGRLGVEKGHSVYTEAGAFVHYTGWNTTFLLFTGPAGLFIILLAEGAPKLVDALFDKGLSTRRAEKARQEAEASALDEGAKRLEQRRQELADAWAEVERDYLANKESGP